MNPRSSVRSWGHVCYRVGMSAYKQTEDIIDRTIAEFGGQAIGLATIITDRIKEAGLKIEPRATARKQATTKAAKQANG